MPLFNLLLRLNRFGRLALQFARFYATEVLWRWPRFVRSKTRLAARRAITRKLDIDQFFAPRAVAVDHREFVTGKASFPPLPETVDIVRHRQGVDGLSEREQVVILLGREILDGRADQRFFGALDIAVRRNAFGRQVDSFEADLTVDGVEGPPVHAVFIRAPVVERVDEGVEVLAAVAGQPVLVRQGHVMAAAFHPELGDDARLHQLFIDQVV